LHEIDPPRRPVKSMRRAGGVTLASRVANEHRGANSLEPRGLHPPPTDQPSACESPHPLISVGFPGRPPADEWRSVVATQPLVVHIPQLVFSVGVALLCRLAKPLHRLSIALRHSLASEVHVTEHVLRAGVALLSQGPPYPQCNGVVAPLKGRFGVFIGAAGIKAE
jgi:hypothetical protein